MLLEGVSPLRLRGIHLILPPAREITTNRCHFYRTRTGPSLVTESTGHLPSYVYLHSYGKEDYLCSSFSVYGTEQPETLGKCLSYTLVKITWPSNQTGRNSCWNPWHPYSWTQPFQIQVHMDNAIYSRWKKRHRYNPKYSLIGKWLTKFQLSSTKKKFRQILQEMCWGYMFSSHKTL